MTAFADNTNNQLTSDDSISHDNINNMANISYQFDFARFSEHLVDVSLSFTATADAPQLWVPAWIPGSYLMREFARNITAVHYRITDRQKTDNDSQFEIYRAQKIRGSCRLSQQGRG